MIPKAARLLISGLSACYECIQHSFRTSTNQTSRESHAHADLKDLMRASVSEEEIWIGREMCDRPLSSSIFNSCNRVSLVNMKCSNGLERYKMCFGKVTVSFTLHLFT